MDNGALVLNSSFSSGDTGKITIDSNSLLLYNSTPQNNNGTSIAIYNASSGSGSSIEISSNTIGLYGGSQIVSSAIGSGTGGSIFIDTENTEVNGYNPVSFAISYIGTLTVGDGIGGNLNYFGGDLYLLNGGALGTNTFSSGDSGFTNIFADNIYISGSFPDPINGNSAIFSGAINISPFIQNIILSPNLNLTGNAGSISIFANQISISDGGQIVVRNDGSGDAGSINITANQLTLKDSLISSSANGGNGGIINLNTESLIMQSGIINSSTTGNGNGGNTTIAAQAIAGDYTSFISANADQGTGGDIAIDTDTLIFRKENITASSNRGVDFSGNIEINAANFGPQQRPELQPERFTEPSTTTCNPGSDKVSFVITGDDIPANVDDIAEADSPIKKAPYFIDNATGEKVPLIEMQGWVDQGNGIGIPIAYNEGAFGGSYRAQACKNLAKSANESR
jgi:large exoprotein involved in heme utilization and adhesion